MKPIELDALKCWVWERAGAGSFRYLTEIARAEGCGIADLVLVGGSDHPAVPGLLAHLGEDPAERHDDWAEYLRRYRPLGLRVLWSDEARGGGASGSGASSADGGAAQEGGATPESSGGSTRGEAEPLLRGALAVLASGEEPAPPGLFYRGDASVLTATRRLGVCGTRSITGEGAQNTRALARRAVGEKWLVLHGAARGADEVCARAVARHDGRQVFVVGEGIGHALIEHPLREFFDGQLVVSVRPPFTAPHRGSLIQRNRLIAALSEALVVVQTGPHGGSWYNVRAAREFGHPVLTFERELSASRAEETMSGTATTVGGAAILSEEDLAEGRRRLIAGGARRLSPSVVASCPSDVLAQRVFEGHQFDPSEYLAQMMTRLDQQGTLFEEGGEGEGA